MLANKKIIDTMGSQMNQSAASKPSDYAMKLMSKMGWKEGQGLGKNETGISEHIIIKKREEKVGLGNSEELSAEALNDMWWHDSFSKNLAKFNAKYKNDSDSDDSSSDDEGRKEKNKKKRKRNKKEASKKAAALDDDDEAGKVIDMISYDELFKATGGARLGMRARRRQDGKIKRTEGESALIMTEKEEKKVKKKKIRKANIVKIMIVANS